MDEERVESDDLAPARGIYNAFRMAVPMWILIVVLVTVGCPHR